MSAQTRLHTFGRRDNPALLLLHGIGAGHRLWRRQIDHFQHTRFVIAPDLAGFTGSAAGGPVDVTVVATELEQALQQQEIDRLSVCGISAGASVALALAVRINASIRHLVLSAPQARAPRLAFGLQIAICRAMPERMLLAGMTRLYQSDPEIAATALEDCKALGKQGLLDAMRALWRLDLRDNLSSITAATVVFCGARDRVNIPAARMIAAAIAGATLRIEPDAGHLWNIERSARFNEALGSILASGD